MSKQQFWYTCVVAIEDDSVFLLGTRHGDNQPEDELEIPKKKFIRMFGHNSLHEGQLGTLVLKIRANGKSTLRGWPYRWRWTAEDIAKANAKAELLFKHMRSE